MNSGPGVLARSAVVGLPVLLVAPAAWIPGAAPVVLVGLLLAVNAVLFTLAPWGGGGSATGSSRPAQALAAGWVVAIAFNLHDFSGRSTAEAVSDAGAQSGLELLLFGVIGVVAISVLRTGAATARGDWGWAGISVWVLASSLWSDYPAYTLARGAQYVALAALATATVSLRGRHADALPELAWTVLRWLVRLTLALMALGLAFGPRFVVQTAANVGRFTWPGAHPTQSAFLMGASLIVVLGSPPRRLRLGGGGRLLVVAALAGGLYGNGSRTALAGVGAAGALLLWQHLRDQPHRGVAWAPFVVLGPIALALAAGRGIGGYVLRGGDVGKLTSLNGRTDLWEVGIGALESFGHWVHGLGFGATRTVFVDQFSFAGSAHNSLLGLLVNLGVVGVALMAGVLLRAVGRLARAVAAGSDLAVPLLAALVFTTVIASTADELAEPTFGTAVLFFAGAVAIALPASGPAEATPGVATAREPQARISPT